MVCRMCANENTMESPLQALLNRKHLQVSLREESESRTAYDEDPVVSIWTMVDGSNQSMKVSSVDMTTDEDRLHSGGAPQKAAKSSTGSFWCNACPQSFSSEANLNKHRRIHRQLVYYSCGVCKRRFSSKSSLNIHSVVHSDARPFVCLECPNAYTTKAQLVRHRKRTHH